MLALFLSFSLPSLFPEWLRGHVFVPAFSSRSGIEEEVFPPKVCSISSSLIPGRVEIRGAFRWGSCGGCAGGWGDATLLVFSLDNGGGQYHLLINI